MVLIRNQFLRVVKPKVERHNETCQERERTACDLIAREANEREPAGQQYGVAEAKGHRDDFLVLENTQARQPDDQTENQKCSTGGEQPLNALRIEQNLQERPMRFLDRGRERRFDRADAIQLQPAAQRRQLLARFAVKLMSLHQRDTAVLLMLLDFARQELPAAQRANARSLLDDAAGRAARLELIHALAAAKALQFRRIADARQHRFAGLHCFAHLGASGIVIVPQPAPLCRRDAALIVPFLEATLHERVCLAQLQPIFISRATSAASGVALEGLFTNSASAHDRRRSWHVCYSRRRRIA